MAPTSGPRSMPLHHRARAEWIAWQLEQAGYQAILQAWDFEPGDNFVARMRDALEQADRTMALVSDAYLAHRGPAYSDGGGR